MKQRTHILFWIIATGLLAGGALTYLDQPEDRFRPEFTQEELQWVHQHANQIRVAPLPDAPPIDFMNEDGLHLGLTSDYFQLIEQQLGIRFVIVECESWKEILVKLKNQEVDVVGSVQDTPERHAFLRFTEPYLRIDNVILTRKTEKKTFSVDHLRGMTIAVVDGSATHDHLLKNYPDYLLTPVKDAAAGFQMVSLLEADAMVADLGVASYYIEKLGITNLRVAGNIDYPWELCLASRKDWPLLNSILNKALANITKDQRIAIQKKWVTLDDTNRVSHEHYLKVTGSILLFTLLAIGAVVFWNRTLRKQITHHARELGLIRQSHAQATQDLDESEERFRMLIESSSDMIWEMDPYGCYLYVSPRVRDMLGYSSTELIGMSSHSLMPPKDSARNIERLRTCNARTTIDCEISTYFHKDGHKVIMESSGRAFVDNTGQLAGFRGVSRDITERIENEIARRQSEERFRNLVETTSDWIWEVNTSGIYSYTSPQSSELLGYSPDELLGKHFTGLMPPAEAETVRALFSDAVNQGEPIQSLVNINRHKDGHTVVLETSAVPFYDKDWNIQGYRGIDRDITDRVAVEKQLNFERSLFRSFMEHAPDLIFFKDVEGHFIEVNAAKAEQVNLNPEDLIGRTDFDFLPAHQAQKTYEDELEVMNTRQPIQQEEQATTPNGNRWYLTTKIPRYDEAGKVIGTFGTSWDITHRKLAEEQLRQLRALLSNTIDSMPSILVGVDAEGTVIQWNRQAESTTGRLPAEVLGKPLRKVFPALHKEMVKVERAIRERTVQKEERLPVQEDHRTRYHDITVYPLLEGEIEGAVIRVDDVTDRVMIENSIRNMVEGVAAVGHRFFNSMVDQMAKTLDADFTFISEFTDDTRKSMHTIAVSHPGSANTNFEFNLAGTPCEHILASNTSAFIEHASERYPETELLQTLKIESYIGIPLVDSEKKVLGVMVAMYQKPLEQVEFAISIMQVFAGRTAAELERLQVTKQLASLRNMLENIINSMPSILVGIDAEGRVMQWNHEAENITGISSTQAQGQPLKSVFPDFGNEMNRVLDCLGEYKLHRHEHIHCTIHGDPHRVDVTIYPITTDGSEGAVIRMDDVTDRVHIEEMMMQSEKMMSVGGLAAGMAHEINNPLAGILQNLQVIRNRITHNTQRNIAAAEEAGTSLKTIQTYMEERGLLKMMDSISDAGRRAAKIVDNMLSFSRKDEAHFAPNDLAEIIERSIELASNDYNLKKRFDFRHIHILREFESLAPIPCEGGQIQQVILNVLSNSAQAMADRPGDAPDPQIILRLKAEKKMVLIEIEDNGPGMSPETCKRAFEPFFTTKDVGHGTGLGLSVSYFIITENHGGTMNLVSSLGQGACFSIRIPYEHRMARWGLRL